MTLQRPLEDDRTLPRKDRLGAARICIALAILSAFLGCTRSMPENFDCVEEGILYRSGQPGAKALERMVGQFGIKTIVNLRSEDRIKEDPPGQEEIQFAREHEVNLIILPYGDSSPEVQTERFLSIVGDPANHPVLVHCARGRERSGVMVAVYRMAVNGWPPERALEEMKKYGFKPDEEPEKTRFVMHYGRAATE